MVSALVLESRFWPRVNRAGPLPKDNPQLGNCWLWTGGQTADGFGILYVGGGHAHQRQARAHRFAWEMEYGALEDVKVCVGQRCGVRLCVRASHLFLDIRSSPCSVEGCVKLAQYAKSPNPLCTMHGARLQRTGTVGPPGTLRSFKAAEPGAPMAFIRAALGSDTDECILWPYALMPTAGYGTINVDGRAQPVHMVVLRLLGRAAGPGQQTRHLCGRRDCINPRHLLAGTPTENARDKLHHGTHLQGEAIASAKLTEDSVRLIRASAEPSAQLAARLGVCTTTINTVRRRAAWRHVDP